jgi:hypothetical protein
MQLRTASNLHSPASNQTEYESEARVPPELMDRIIGLCDCEGDENTPFNTLMDYSQYQEDEDYEEVITSTRTRFEVRLTHELSCQHEHTDSCECHCEPTDYDDTRYGQEEYCNCPHRHGWRWRYPTRWRSPTQCSHDRSPIVLSVSMIVMIVIDVQS